MTVQRRVTVRGGGPTWTELNVNLRKLEDIMSRLIAPELVYDALSDGAEMVEETAKRLVPVDTGNLRESIHAEPHLEGGMGTVRVGVSHEDAHYAPYVEFGTRRMVARPYLRPAIAENRDKIIRSVADELRWIVEGV
jgi:HK97 gp10 family phage protein